MISESFFHETWSSNFTTFKFSKDNGIFTEYFFVNFFSHSTPNKSKKMKKTRRCYFKRRPRFSGLRKDWLEFNGLAGWSFFVVLLPVFKPLRTRYQSVNDAISNSVLIHIVIKCRPTFTKSPSLVQIVPIVSMQDTAI